VVPEHIRRKRPKGKRAVDLSGIEVKVVNHYLLHSRSPGRLRKESPLFSIRTISASAILYSIAETAKANGLNPFEYFKFLMEQLKEYPRNDVPEEELKKLMPWSETQGTVGISMMYERDENDGRNR
jgi:hypothetical protein